MALETREAYEKRTAAETWKTRSGAATPWYLGDESSCHELLFEHSYALRGGPLASYRAMALRNMRLYAGSISVSEASSTQMQVDRIRYNLIRSCIGSMAAVLCASRTLPFAQTRGGDWALRRKAAQFNRTIQQQFMSIGTFDRSMQVTVDALVTGLGYLKFYQDQTEDGATTACQRGIPLALAWDPMEATLGHLSQISERTPVNKDQLVELYARDANGRYDDELAKKIVEAAGPDGFDIEDFQLLSTSRSANQAMVCEAWKLPSTATSDDGYHAICLSDVTLRLEPWAKRRFPLSFLRGFEPNAVGFSGVSLVDQLEPFQRRLEELAKYIDRCQKRGSGPRVFAHSSTKIQPDQINNAEMSIVMYEGQPGGAGIQFDTFDATPHDLENSFDRLREQAMSEIGLSQTQTQGETDDGITSAVGQQTREDIQSKRHVVHLRYMEKFYLNCAECIIDTNDAIADDPDSSGFKVERAARGEWLESSDWKEIRIPINEARVAVLPVSQLVGSVSAQLDMVELWVNRGYCPPETAKMLFGQPDTEGQADEDTEDTRFAHWFADKVLDGERIAVDPYADPMEMVRVFLVEYKRARQHGAPEPVLQEFRRVLNSLQSKITAAQQAQAVQAQPPTANVAPINAATPADVLAS